MLSPRLPSLFEPAGRGGAAVAEESFQVRTASPGEQESESAPLRARHAESRVAVAEASVPMPVPRPVAETSAQTVAPARVVAMEAMQATVTGRPAISALAAEPEPLHSTRRTEQRSTDDPGPLRETHVLRERIVSEPAHDERLGVLLPPAQPVFAARHDVEARTANRTARSSPASDPGLPRESRETAVHVSIGRLEVRAAAAPPAAAPRKESVRPASLDDYLRQRSGKTP
jgi:hypothetical protein